MATDAAELLAGAAAEPIRLIGVGPARDHCPALSAPGTILHGGPPLDGARPTGAMTGALIGALLFEGAAATADEAQRLLHDGAYELKSCHTVGGVGAMAGAVTASMPVVAVERAGVRAFAPLNEGLGAAVRFGDFDDGTIARLRHLAGVVAPALDRALHVADPVDVVQLQADALRRGDECHNRNVAASALLTTRIAAAIVRANDRDAAAATLDALSDNPHGFRPVSWAAAKAAADALHECAPPGIVTAPAGSTRAITSPTRTVSPSFFTRRSTPALGAFMSVFALSVSSSQIASSCATCSPSRLCHLIRIACVTDSPSDGTTTSIAMIFL
jgi:hypothetical protein